MSVFNLKHSCMKYLYVSLIIMLLGLTSCNHWLDVEPKTSIPTDKQFESEPGFKDALTGIYLKLGTTQLYAGDLTYAYLDELADRKSTRLNSSHANISYAVFCLKKKILV